MKYSGKSLKSLILSMSLLGGVSLYAQDVVYKVNEFAGLDYLVYPQVGGDTIQFHHGEFGGPALLLNGRNLPLMEKASERGACGLSSELKYAISYEKVKGGALKINITCQNVSGKALNDIQLSLRMGINTLMKSYPQWRAVYFPTLMKCEKTHFWGYLMNPNGNILTLASPDPIASYHLGYNNNGSDFANGHLIFTVYLDLMNPEPLPSENPDNCNSLKKGESRTWSVYLTQVNSLDRVGPVVQKYTEAPFLSSKLYTVKEGENLSLDILSGHRPHLKLIDPNGKKSDLKAVHLGGEQYCAHFRPTAGKGVYTVEVTTQHKTSTAWLSVRHSWANYIKAARQASLDYPQIASSHTEGWYGFFSASVAERYFPNPAVDSKVHEKFDELFPLMYDEKTYLPTSWQDRIQNHAMMASLLSHKYRAEKKEKYMVAASVLADYMLMKQTADGAYRNGNTHYTSVDYIGKAILEVMEVEKELAKNSAYWQLQYNRHYASVKRAMDELTRNLDNIQTEGEQTFEDGMISCSYAQLAMFALMQPEGSAERKKYTEAARYLIDSHRCLSQLLIPDSRVHGASIRFWESQYDILTYPNFINSPHGWSAWRIYGLKYMYQLTGEEKYLIDMNNSIGACAQLLNPSTGKLHWAFVSDPYVHVKYFVKDEKNPGKGCRVDSIIGRQYLNMIGDWYKAPKGKFVTGYWGYDGGCCNNDVHEIFKCMGELVLTSAYFHVHDDGTFFALNCSAKKEDGKWVVRPDSNLIEVLYTNKDNVQFDVGKVSVVGR